MKKFTSQEIKEFVSKPLFDEKVLLDEVVSSLYNESKFLERRV